MIAPSSRPRFRSPPRNVPHHGASGPYQTRSAFSMTKLTPIFDLGHLVNADTRFLILEMMAKEPDQRPGSSASAP